MARPGPASPRSPHRGIGGYIASTGPDPLSGVGDCMTIQGLPLSRVQNLYCLNRTWPLPGLGGHIAKLGFGPSTDNRPESGSTQVQGPHCQSRIWPSPALQGGHIASTETGPPASPGVHIASTETGPPASQGDHFASTETGPQGVQGPNCHYRIWPTPPGPGLPPGSRSFSS
jgi:hypothetical protein